MQRDTLQVALVAVMCILALSVAASTLNSVEGGGGEGGLVGTIAGWLPIPNPTAEERPEDAGVPSFDGRLAETLNPLQALFCIPALRDPTVQAAIALAFLATVGLVVWRGDLLQAGTALAILATPTVLFLFVFAFTMRGCRAETAGLDSGEVSAGMGGSGGGDGAAVAVTNDPALLVLAVGLVGLVVAAVALVGSSGDDDAAAPETAEPSPSGGPPAVTAIAQAAGAAADRIEADGELDNEVYRAWREMTDDLDVPNPEASTPAEFRAAAVEAGIAPEDVDELTATFEAVRYGGAAPTSEREDRAVAALRRIERGYGGTDRVDGEAER